MSITRATRTPARGRHTTGKETALFVLAATVIAIHVIDDSFLQPQPGTSAGDHVFSGLIPLALLALAGWAFPRVRSGAQGAIALTLVIPAILSGAEGLYLRGR